MKQILVVDDEPNMRRVLKLFLEREGFGVRTCCNGQEALAAIDTLTPDALVTDIKMPIMSGKELCLALEALTPQRRFPIFIMTSMTDREHREWTSRMARVEFLEKPLSVRQLMQRLRNVLEPDLAESEPTHD